MCLSDAHEVLKTPVYIGERMEIGQTTAEPHGPYFLVNGAAGELVTDSDENLRWLMKLIIGRLHLSANHPVSTKELAELYQKKTGGAEAEYEAFYQINTATLILNKRIAELNGTAQLYFHLDGIVLG